MGEGETQAYLQMVKKDPVNREEVADPYTKLVLCDS